MMRLFMLFVGAGIFYGCESHQYVTSFKEIDYSFDNGWGTGFSIRLFADGTFVCAKGKPQQQRYYVAKVDFNKLKEIEKNYLNVLSCSAGSIYRDSIVDAASYKIVANDRHFYVYGNGEPGCLLALHRAFQWLSKRPMNRIQTTIHFKSLENYYPPAPVIDSSAFVPPSKIPVIYLSNAGDTVISFSIEGLSAEGSEIKAHYHHDTIIRAKAEIFGETGKTLIAYDFIRNGVIKATEEQYVYQRPISEIISANDIVLQQTIQYLLDSTGNVISGNKHDITPLYNAFRSTVPLVLKKK